jgi:hypothetical protein
MSTTLTRITGGKLIIELDPGEPLFLMTQAELGRAANRSPEFVRARVEAGIIFPLGRTDSGILLFGQDSLPSLCRPMVERNGRMIETTAASL